MAEQDLEKLRNTVWIESRTRQQIVQMLTLNSVSSDSTNS